MSKYVCFHSSFRKTPRPQSIRMAPGDFGVGVYFSTSLADTRQYGSMSYEAQVLFNRPLVIEDDMTRPVATVMRAYGIDEYFTEDFDEGLWHGVVGLINVAIETNLVSEKSFGVLINKMGYDGIVVPNEIVVQSKANSEAKGDYLVVLDYDSILSWTAL